MICEKRFKAAVYTAKVYSMIGRTIDHNTISKTHLRLLEEHLNMVKYHNNHNKLPEIRHDFGIIKSMDLVPSHICERLVIMKFLLSYVTCDNVQPDLVEAQVVNGVNGASYATIKE